MLIGTLIIYFNLVFYCPFTDFITIPQLFQTSNIADLSSSVLSLMKVYDVFLFIDVVFIWYLSKKEVATMHVNYHRSSKVFALTVSLVLLTGNFLIAEIERPQLFTRAFDREYLVKNIGLFNYHMYDVFVHSKTKTKRVFADGNELPEIEQIEQFMNDKLRTSEKTDLFGVSEDRNIILISAESIQSFVVDNEVNGEVVTPFLNDLIKNEHTYYFDNFYH